MAEKWVFRKEVYCKFLFDYILRIVYKSISEEIGYPTVEFGFSSPPNSQLHRGILTFLKTCVDLSTNANEMIPLFTDSVTSLFIFKILDETVHEMIFEDVILATEIYKSFILNDRIVELLISHSSNLFVETALSFQQLVSSFFILGSPVKPEILSNSKIFL